MSFKYGKKYSSTRKIELNKPDSVPDHAVNSRFGERGNIRDIQKCTRGESVSYVHHPVGPHASKHAHVDADIYQPGRSGCFIRERQQISARRERENTKIISNYVV